MSDSRPSTELAGMGRRLIANLAKNNHFTADPIFLVQSKRRIYGIDTDYDPKIAWMHGEDRTELDAPQSAIAEAFYQERQRVPRCIYSAASGDYVGDLKRVGYIEQWEFVQAFFTPEAADYFIATNSHRHSGALRVYVDSGYRNWEWQAIRAALIAAAETTPRPPEEAEVLRQYRERLADVIRANAEDGEQPAESEEK